ncbi:hypothetical protein ACQKCH_16000 [Nubsella zeaxanthinifaciens]|uniref:hypothetical protein n=1 Tax=Nubsella zeaxanthinifaciens TaxID=392412 RepID=UPI003D06F032
MKIYTFLLLASFFCSTNVFGQEFNKKINKDSLLKIVITKLPEEKKKEFLKEYKKGNESTKEFLLFMLSMPTSSKKELIANIDLNFEKINYLKTEYLKLVPKGYVVYIEFNPADNITMTKENIDLKIEYVDGKEKKIIQEWNLEYNSPKLAQMLIPLKWTSTSINSIKQMLSDANCISIENSEITTIGFARSGMGKYSFKLFNDSLTPEEINEFNDGCTYIFYKKNIVLEYGGGAIGPQCFPKP